MKDVKVGFIGFGKMGFALAAGAVGAKIVPATRILAYDVDVNAKKHIRKNKFKVAKSIRELVEQSNLIFLCVKPQQMRECLSQIALGSSQSENRKKCFISIAAGISFDVLKKGLGTRIPFIRVMPNTPALLKAGMSVMSVGPSATPAQVRWVKALLSGVGQVARVTEDKMHAVTAVSGSGPAYGFYLAESMIQAATKVGLNKQLAQQLVHQTLYGAGQMLAKTTLSADVLRKNVTSPGGTTEAALTIFEKRKMRRIILQGIQNAVVRSKQLAK